MRHGEAYSSEEDPQRGLNERGCSNIEKIAELLKSKNVSIDMIYHSDKLRAIQTAKIIAEKLSIVDKMKQHPFLDPECNVNQLSALFEQMEENTIFVGHMPNLEILMSYLLNSGTGNPDFFFLPGSIACLKYEDEEYSLEWSWPGDYN